MNFQYIQIFLVYLLLICKGIYNSKVLPCDEKDKKALLMFKHGVIDPSGVLSSWSAEKQNCCRWPGVLCENTTGKVTGLNLTCPQIYPVYGNDNKLHCLSGELNISSLFELQFLSSLELGNNDFSIIHYHGQGGNSSNNLHHLDLSDNGNLKADHMLHWISNLSSLQYLDLTGINLQEETNWLQLVTLLPSLSQLHLEYCGLRDIYPSLQYANFTALEVLDLSNNDFVSAKLPNWIFNFSSDILAIFLSKNSLQGQLPQTFPHFQSLEYLFLDENALSGSIPNWVGQLEKLEILYLSRNLFSGPFPLGLKNLSSLLCLSLESNSFTGNISENFFHSFSNLEYLGFGSQSLLFDFDPQWIPHFQLQALILDAVRSKLPSWIYRQDSLSLLNILNSRIQLEPSEKFWRFISNQVEYLVFQNSSINGNISNVLFNSKVLMLNSNNFRGNVPRISPKVTLLDLSNNSLSGSIFHFLCRKTKEENNLKYLDLSHNLLSGEIPNCWIHWKSLEYINLEGNNFRGQIPYSISNLSNLVSFSLFNNRLSGEVPGSLKNCEKLRILNLGENKFSGAISNWVGQNIIALQLRSNLFSGNIPTTICKLDFLKILDLSNNKLSGPIPSCYLTSMISKNESFDSFVVTILLDNIFFTFYYNLTMLIKGIKLDYSHSMRAIDYSNNNLSGRIPVELFMLTGLQSLNLSENQLTGMISQDIGNLILLESLDLSKNLFSGQIPQDMSKLSFLGDLNLSCNNFEGKIPSGTQLQGFQNLCYMENPNLCGPPLTKICPQDEEPPNEKQMREDNDDNFEFYSMFYMGLEFGFAISFLVVWTTIFFNRRFRYGYFKFVDMVLQKFNSVVEVVARRQFISLLNNRIRVRSIRVQHVANTE